MAGVNTAAMAKSPWARALASIISPVPGTSMAMNSMANYWLGQNVGSGNTAQALGLGYADETPEINPSEFYTRGDTASRSGGSNFSASRMMPGSGSRMNPNSGFIWAMPGYGQQMEPQRINMKLHQERPGE